MWYYIPVPRKKCFPVKTLCVKYRPFAGWYAIHINCITDSSLRGSSVCCTVVLGFLLENYIDVVELIRRWYRDNGVESRILIHMNGHEEQATVNSEFICFMWATASTIRESKLL